MLLGGHCRLLSGHNFTEEPESRCRDRSKTRMNTGVYVEELAAGRSTELNSKLSCWKCPCLNRRVKPPLVGLALA